MALVLLEKTEHCRKSGCVTVDIAAGKTLKVETSPQGTEILTAVVPAGKVWTCTILVYIEERSA